MVAVELNPWGEGRVREGRKGLESNSAGGANDNDSGEHLARSRKK
jgi:hypothetical protein